MVPPNENPQAGSEAVERGPRGTLSMQRIALQRSLGSLAPIDKTLTAQELLEREKADSADSVIVTSFHQLNRSNLVLYRRKAIQEAALLRSDAPLELLLEHEFSPDEYLVANRLMAYDQQVSELTQYIADTVERRESLTDIIGALPEGPRAELREKELIVEQVLGMLHRTIDERIALSNVFSIDSVITDTDRNVITIDQFLSQVPPPEPALAERYRQLRAKQVARKTSLLSKRSIFINQLKQLGATESIRLLEGRTAAFERYLQGQDLDAFGKVCEQSQQVLRERINTVEKQIIDIARGEILPEGAPKGFIVPFLIIDILKARYDQIVEEQKRMTDERIAQKEGGQQAFDRLSVERSMIMRELITVTHEAAGYQQRMAATASLQDMFAALNTEGALVDIEKIKDRTTDIPVQDDAREKMQRSKNYHLDRIAATVDSAQENFSVDAFVIFHETVRKSAQGGVEFGVWLSRKLMGILPDAAQGFLEGKLIGPLADALAWPKHPDGRYKLWDEMTDEERNEIEKKFQSLMDAIEKFQKENNGNEVKDTVAALRSLDAASGVGLRGIGVAHQEIAQREAAHISAAQIPAKLEQYMSGKPPLSREDAVATLQAVLLLQLSREWGTVEFERRKDDQTGLGLKSGTGFIGAYARLLSTIEDIIGQQLNVAEHAYQVSDNFFMIAKYLAAAAGVVFVAPIIVGAGGLTIAASTVKYGVKGARWAFGKRAPVSTRPPSTPMQRMLWGGAVAFEGYNLYQQYHELQADHERIGDVKGRILADLSMLGFNEDPKDSGIFKHENGAVLRLNIQDLNGPLDAQRWNQYTRLGLGGLRMGTLLWMGAKGVGKRTGVLYLAILAVEKGVDASDAKQTRDFFAKCPPYLSVLLGGAQNVTKGGKNDYDVLKNASNWNFIFTSTEEDKQAVRDNMLYTIFNYEIGSVDPERLRHMTGGQYNAQEIMSFFEHDFHDVVLQYAYARLYHDARAEGKWISWQEIAQGRVERDSWFAITPSISFLELRSAMREAGILCSDAHVPEKQYIALLQEKARLEQQPGIHDALYLRQLADIEYLLSVLGQRTVLGGTLQNEVTLETVTANGGKTRAQCIVEALANRAKIAAETSATVSFVVEAGTIAGLPRKIDFTSSSSLFGSVLTNPGDQVGMQRIVPLTTAEPEGSTDPEWYIHSLRPIFGENPIGPTVDNLPRTQRIEAAQIVLSALDPEAVVQPNTSAAAAKEMITRHAVQLFAKKREGRAVRWEEGRMYEYRVDPSAPEVSIGPIARDPRFQEQLKLGSFREIWGLPEGQNVALTTYIFGNVDDPTSIYVLQNAAVKLDTTYVNARHFGLSSQMIRDEAERTNTSVFYPMYGQALVMSGADFARNQPGGKAMIDRVVTDHKIERAKNDAQRERAIAEIRKEQSPERAAVHEQAAKNPYTLFRLPSSLPKYSERVLYDPARGFLYLITTDANREPAFSAVPGKEEIERASKFPTEIIVQGRGPVYMHGNYPALIAQAGGDYPPYLYMLSQPFAESPRFSIQKVLALYVPVGRIGERWVETIENTLIPLYETLQNDTQRRRFLHELNTAMYWATRKDGPRDRTWQAWMSQELLTSTVIPELERRLGLYEKLYPAAKEASDSMGKWILDSKRELNDGYKNRIEYVSDIDGTIYSQTTDGLQCWIHNLESNGGIPQPGKYFNGTKLLPLPDPNTHRYDPAKHEWIAK